MNLILNIGLATFGNTSISEGVALHCIRECGFRVVSHTVQNSNTEATVVAHVTNGYSFTPVVRRVEALSTMLFQDCVAVYNPDEGTGYLAGPRAAAWGEFNPEFFLMLEGTPLSAQVQAAA